MEKASVHILYGSDELAIQRHIQVLVEKMGDPTNASMNITSLDGRNLKFDDLHTAVNAVPFLSERRLVVLSNTYSAFKGEKRKDAEQKKKKLTSLVSSMPATTTLVLFDVLDGDYQENKKINGWMSKLKSLSVTGITLNSQQYYFPKQEGMAGWIVNESRKQAELLKKQAMLEPDAARLLAEMVGNDTRIASQEIGKLLEYVNYERNILEDDVQRVCIVNDQADIFQLVEALANRDGKTAQSSLMKLLQDQDPRTIWAMIVRQFRLLLQVRALMDAREGVDAIAQRLRIHPYGAGKMLNQARKFSLPDLEKIYRRLLKLEEEVWSFKLDFPMAMEILVAELSS